MQHSMVINEFLPRDMCAQNCASPTPLLGVVKTQSTQKSQTLGSNERLL